MGGGGGLVFQKNEYFSGNEEIVNIFGGHYNIGLI